uniref:Uncharacterized protein n=1 Tax=Anguilla anguilla TaxID=7936 RepID=A0A0E9RY29_ANGAN
MKKREIGSIVFSLLVCIHIFQTFLLYF